MDLEGLIRRGRKRPLFALSETNGHVLDVKGDQLLALLPHRPPFLFVERITLLDRAQCAAIGERTVAVDDPVFRGHFPGEPVYPGVLLIETIAQLSICLQSLLDQPSGEAAPANLPPRLRLLRVHHALFVSEARPGDTLTILSQIIDENGYTATLAGQVMRGDAVCTVAVVEAYKLDE